ncbi:MAG: hypothetical protein ABIR66_13380 [Saprospiraceae bacterium]
MEVQNFFLKEQSMLGLNSIKSGYNGSQIRMWIKHGYGENPKNSSQLIVIKRNDNGFSGELHTYLLKYGENWDSIVSITKRLDILKPESGWKDLIDKMEKLDINVLPDYQKIAGYYVNADSYGVMVEISSNEKYRLYYYPDYMERKDQFKQAMNMFEIMRLMEREFNIKLIY